MTASLHPDLQRQLIVGTDLAAEVEQAARYLSELMQEIHGGDWHINVNHEVCFAMVSRDSSETKGTAT